jgi:flavin-dependent dehydrogenase
MLLARAGLRVLLVDRAKAGSDTLSTHALMRGGVLQLHRWGVLDEIVGAGTPPVHTVVFDYPGERVPIAIKPSPGVEALYAPRRTLLDRVLADAALDAGAEVRFGVTVTDLVQNGSAVVGVTGRDEDHEFRANAELVVGADGSRSSVARLARAPTTKAGANANAVIYGYWESVDAAGYEWFYRPGFAAGVIPTNDGRTLVFSAVPPERFRAQATGHLEGAFKASLGAHAPELLERLGGGERVERFHGFKGAAGFMRRPWGPGWALVGDAAYYKDPITVHGITDALRDAELLALAVIEGGNTALARYESERDRVSHELFDVTDKIASHDWTMPELKQLLRAMSASMVDEIALLEGLHFAKPKRPEPRMVGAARTTGRGTTSA